MMKQGLTKHDSLSIKGIAVLMLLFHHLFCSVDRFSAYDITFAPFEQNIVVKISFFFKICVSIFAFITGYGLLKSIAKTPFNRKDIIKWNCTRLVKTMSGFWFIYVIAFIVTMIINQRPLTVYFNGKVLTGIIYILNDFFGLANLLNTPTLLSTWWYMSAAIIFILIVPIVYAVSKKIGYLPILFIFIALPRLLNVGYTGGTNLYTFVISVVMGMIFADYDLFNKIEDKLPKNKVISYIVSFILFGALCVLSFIVSLRYDRTVAWELNYGVIPVVFICFFRFCIVRIPVLKQVLAFLGKHSMTIFLSHTFIRGIYLGDFIYSFGNFILIYIVLIATSLVLALVLDFIKDICKYDKLIGKVTKKIQEI